MTRLAILLALVAFPASAMCRTECGALAPQADEAQCAELQQLEAAAIESYAKHTHWTAAAMCRSLAGWYVIVNPRADKHGAWLMPNGVSDHHGPVFVLGITSCEQGVTMLGRYDWAWSAYAHEMGHVFDCHLAPGHLGHEGWTSRGICAAVNAVSLLQDECDEYD